MLSTPKLYVTGTGKLSTVTVIFLPSLLSLFIYHILFIHIAYAINDI